MLHVDGIHTVRAIPVVVGIAVCGNAAFGRKSGARKDHNEGPFALDLHRFDAEVGKREGCHVGCSLKLYKFVVEGFELVGHCAVLVETCNCSERIGMCV